MWVPGAKPKMKTHNSDMDGLAIVIRGNKATKNVATGDYVLVENSTISGIADGGYKAAANVSAGTAFTSANLTPLSKGAVTQIGEDVATLNSNLALYAQTKITNGNMSSGKMIIGIPTGHTHFHGEVMLVAYTTGSVNRNTYLFKFWHRGTDLYVSNNLGTGEMTVTSASIVNGTFEIQTNGTNHLFIATVYGD